MSGTNKEKKPGIVPIGVGILVFLLAFTAGVISKIAIRPSWSKEYDIRWSDALGTRISDLPYGERNSNRFDLYLPKNGTKENYGLVIYLHAGGFTSGDKADDERMLSWLCSKGYVAAGINYTLQTGENKASVLTQSEEIKAAVPIVIREAAKAGYHIDRMAAAGGSAGHTLAMIYAYRDGQEAPVPVVLTFGAVGPSCFHQEDWCVYGLNQHDDACAAVFGLVAGVEITGNDIRDGSYLEKMKPISPAEWVKENPVPTVVAYGACDKLQPFPASIRLKTTLEESGADFRYFELPHSGHGLQNDNVIFQQWMKAVEDYLEKYLPVNEH